MVLAETEDPSKSPDEPGLTFEERLRRLEEIVAELERGGESLESSLELFEEGTAHLRALTAELDRAEKRVERLAETSEGPTVGPIAVGEADREALGGKDPAGDKE